MPIRPEHRWLYPIDWRELSQAIRFGRAKGRCEGCGRLHGLKVRDLGDGRWTRVVLARPLTSIMIQRTMRRAASRRSASAATSSTIARSMGGAGG